MYWSDIKRKRNIYPIFGLFFMTIISVYGFEISFDKGVYFLGFLFGIIPIVFFATMFQKAVKDNGSFDIFYKYYLILSEKMLKDLKKFESNQIIPGITERFLLYQISFMDSFLIQKKIYKIYKNFCVYDDLKEFEKEIYSEVLLTFYRDNINDYNHKTIKDFSECLNMDKKRDRIGLYQILISKKHFDLLVKKEYVEYLKSM